MSSIIHRSSALVEYIHGDGLEGLVVLLPRGIFLISIRCLSAFELNRSDVLTDLHLLYLTPIIFYLVGLIEFWVAFGGLAEDICRTLTRLNLSQLTLIQFWRVLLIIGIVSSRRLFSIPRCLKAICTRICSHIISELITVFSMPLQQFIGSMLKDSFVAWPSSRDKRLYHTFITFEKTSATEELCRL